LSRIYTTTRFDMSGGIACVCAMCIEHVWKKCANKMLLLHF